jgi:hypothetical protein
MLTSSTEQTSTKSMIGFFAFVGLAVLVALFVMKSGNDLVNSNFQQQMDSDALSNGFSPDNRIGICYWKSDHSYQDDWYCIGNDSQLKQVAFENSNYAKFYQTFHEGNMP